MEKTYTITRRDIKEGNVTSVPVIPFNPTTGDPGFHPSLIRLAMWDTGCSHTVISESIVEELKLIPCGIEDKIISATDVRENLNKYCISIKFENGMVIENYEVTAIQMMKPIDIAIGMDIIGHSDFAITNSNNQIVFSFRYPSQVEIDFTKE